MKKQSEELFCSFCGRSSKEVPIIPGPDANICADCVKHANDLISRAEKKATKAPPLPPTPTPRAIKEFLDQFVIGHDETKKILAVAVHNHYRRLEAAANGGKDDDGVARKREITPISCCGLPCSSSLLRVKSFPSENAPAPPSPKL